MRILGSVVAPSASFMPVREPEIMDGGSIRSQVVRDQFIWDIAIFSQQLAHRPCHMWTPPFGKGFYERSCNTVGCSHVGMDGPASPGCRMVARSAAIATNGGGLCK